MKVLLDECIDWRFSHQLKPFFVRTVPQMGWAGIRNGSLLNLAQTEFDVFITVDRNLSFQQDVGKFDIAILVIKVKSNRLADLVPIAQLLLEALPNAKKRTTTIVGIA